MIRDQGEYKSTRYGIIFKINSNIRTISFIRAMIDMDPIEIGGTMIDQKAPWDSNGIDELTPDLKSFLNETRDKLKCQARIRVGSKSNYQRDPGTAVRLCLY